MSETTPAAVRKKISINDILISVLPLIIMLTLNTICTFPAILIGFYMNAKAGIKEIDISVLASDEAQFALMIGFMIYAVVSIIIFYFWYRKAFLKKLPVQTFREAFPGKKVALALGAALGTWGLINLVLNLLIMLSPNLMDNFDQIMDSSGLGSNLITTVVYGSILGPIAEELMFRGVTQSYLRRSGLPIGLVLFIQALFFGIAHLNLVQSSYAVLLGMTFGLVAYKFGNIRMACIVHIVNNMISFGGEIVAAKLGLSDSANMIIYIVLTVIGIVSAVFLIKTPAYVPEAKTVSQQA